MISGGSSVSLYSIPHSKIPLKFDPALYTGRYSKVLWSMPSITGTVMVCLMGEEET